MLKLAKDCCQVNRGKLIGFEQMHDLLDEMKQTVNILAIYSTQTVAQARGPARSAVHNITLFPPDLQSAKPSAHLESSHLGQPWSIKFQSPGLVSRGVVSHSS